MNLLELKHFRMICAITETGNLTRAAEKLFISQSALSQQLKDIEGKLKADLFFRTPRRMIPTPIGKKLMATAQHVIEAVADAELEIARTVSGDRGELKVGTQCLFCFKWLPKVMKRFNSRFPNVELELGTSTELIEELESNRFDLVITAPQFKDDRCDYVDLFADQLVCIMPPDHPLTSRAWVELQDFGMVNLISHVEKERNRFYQLLLKPRGIEPLRTVMVGQPPAMIEMVAAGFGISVFPAWAVRSAMESETITARAITRNGCPLTWQAAFLKNRQLTVFQKEFVHSIRQAGILPRAAEPALLGEMSAG